MDKRGASSVEYVIFLVAVAVAILIALEGFGLKIGALFDLINNVWPK